MKFSSMLCTQFAWIDMIEIRAAEGIITIEPTVVRDDLDGMRDVQIGGAFVTDFLYGGAPIGLKAAVHSVEVALARIACIETEHCKAGQPLPDDVRTELRQLQHFSATYKEEYEWHGVEPGPAEEVIYEIGDIVRQKSSKILASV